MFELLTVSPPAGAGRPGSGSRRRPTPAEPWGWSTPALSRPGSVREKTRLTSAGEHEDGPSSLRLGNRNIDPDPKIACSRWPLLKPEREDRFLGGFLALYEFKNSPNSKRNTVLISIGNFRLLLQCNYYGKYM